ncbi:MAG: M28 family peptidase [Vicinamibacterales bacterium]
MQRHGRTAVLLIALFALAGCSRPSALFSEQNARAHVQMLADTIGSRPPGSDAHARARAYVIDQLRLFGYEVRLQETDARRPEIGRTARVANIIGVLPGARREAIGLLSHYDSRADTPGAGDDAFGVAISLEAARVIAATADRQWTTLVLVTDAEEEGLMGAAALMADAAVRDHLGAYINVEASGSSEPTMLFETGPGNPWLVTPWARRAPNPRGGSFALEIYRRLPNDTDFSILKRHEIPGLNFGLVGDSYSYHTARDTADRLSRRALRETGENVVGIVTALQASDITARTQGTATYFDIGGTVGVSYGSTGFWVTTVLGLILGSLAWVRQTRFLVVQEGAGRWILGLLWMLLALVATVAAMVGAVWLLRAGREVYHPWYARPDRLFLMIAAIGTAVAWMMARAGRWIPIRAKGLRHPAVAWTYTLPVWIALSLAMTWFAPPAAYLWTLPLLTAGIVLVLAPPASSAAVRAASVVVLAVAATLWLRDTIDLLRYMVAVFGRLPIITPVYAYPALIALAGLMIAPPFFAAAAAPAPLLRPALATALALTIVAASSIAAWMAPAYTYEQPLRRYARVFQEPGAARSVWQVGSLEPGLDLGEGAPGGWTTATPEVTSIPWGRIAQPFVFSTSAEPLGAPPAAVTSYSAEPLEGGGTTLRIAVVAKEPSLSISFVLPPGIVPARSNLPGVIRAGRWTATFVAPPPEGIAWQASFAAVTAPQLKDLRVAVTASGVPGGTGWQRLPAWLPQERMVWTVWSTWALDPSVPPPIEPVPPLR